MAPSERDITTLQIVREKLCSSLHQHFSSWRIAYSVPASRKRQDFYILSPINQSIDERKRVREVYVVVPRAMRDQQLPFELFGILYRRRFLIAFFVFRQQPQVALRIDRIVVVPVRNRSSRE